MSPSLLLLILWSALLWRAPPAVGRGRRILFLHAVLISLNIILGYHLSPIIGDKWFAQSKYFGAATASAYGWLEAEEERRQAKRHDGADAQRRERMSVLIWNEQKSEKDRGRHPCWDAGFGGFPNGGTPKFKLDHLVLKPMVTLGSLISRNHHLNPFDRTMLVVPEISSSLTAPACQVLLRPSDSLQGNSPSRTSLE